MYLARLGLVLPKIGMANFVLKFKLESLKRSFHNAVGLQNGCDCIHSQVFNFLQMFWLFIASARFLSPNDMSARNEICVSFENKQF